MGWEIELGLLSGDRFGEGDGLGGDGLVEGDGFGKGDGFWD